jgi:hypothetical protein
MSCALRGSCVPNRVCRCAPGGDGCEAGGDSCPFPGGSAPCELPADANAPQNASVLAPSLERVCPGVLGVDDLVCCDDDQLAALQQQLDMAQGLLANCPACWANFRRFWCVFTCSPRQGSFVEVTASRVCDAALFPTPNSGPGDARAAGCQGTPSAARGVPTVQAVRLSVDAAYASDLFRSCKDVTVSATGQKAVDMAFGGARSAAEFFHFQGVAAYSSGQNPMKIEVVLVDATNNSSSSLAGGSLPEAAGGGGVPPRMAAAGPMREATVACDVEDAELGDVHVAFCTLLCCAPSWPLLLRPALRRPAMLASQRIQPRGISLHPNLTSDLRVVSRRMVSESDPEDVSLLLCSTACRMLVQRL